MKALLYVKHSEMIRSTYYPMLCYCMIQFLQLSLHPIALSTVQRIANANSHIHSRHLRSSQVHSEARRIFVICRNYGDQVFQIREVRDQLIETAAVLFGKRWQVFCMHLDQRVSPDRMAFALASWPIMYSKSQCISIYAEIESKSLRM